MNFTEGNIKAIVATVLLVWSGCYTEFSLASPEVNLELSQVRYEQLTGGIEFPNGQPRSRLLREMPAGTYEYTDGIYKSLFSRISLRLPRIGSEKSVVVREAITMRRPDQLPATTHLIIDTGGLRIMPQPRDAVSAIVVTRLRDDRPKDAESIFSRLDGGTEYRSTLANQSIEYATNNTSLGPGLQRVVPNRAYDDRFPYQVARLKDAQVTTFGVTQFVVVGVDSFLEFSQIFPCVERSTSECKADAIKSMTAFVGGVTGFKMYPPTSSLRSGSENSSGK